MDVSIATDLPPLCGCIATAGLEAIGRHKLKGFVPVGKIFTASLQVGNAVRWVRAGT